MPHPSEPRAKNLVIALSQLQACLQLELEEGRGKERSDHMTCIFQNAWSAVLLQSGPFCLCGGGGVCVCLVWRSALCSYMQCFLTAVKQETELQRNGQHP